MTEIIIVVSRRHDRFDTHLQGGDEVNCEATRHDGSLHHAANGGAS
jgi:hypothetical protein